MIDRVTFIAVAFLYHCTRKCFALYYNADEPGKKMVHCCGPARKARSAILSQASSFMNYPNPSNE